MSGRYFVRCRTGYETGNLRVDGWDVCDKKKFDKIEIAKYGRDEFDKAHAVCKLMNSIEEENHGLSK
jgi:hypothetical protein